MVTPLGSNSGQASRFRDWGPLESAYARCVPAAAEAVYPATECDAPDWQSTEMVQRTYAYVDGLPPVQRRLLKLMFIGVEFLAVVISPGRRFSRRAQPARTDALRRWRASGVLPVRLLGDALKSSLQMVYLSHPAVVRFIGEYKVWTHPEHDYPMPTHGTAAVDG